MSIWDQEHGLRLNVKGEELAAMSNKAVAYHLAKIEEYKAKAAEYAKFTEGLPSSEKPGFNKGSYNSSANPGQDFLNSASSHAGKAKLHTFIRDHLDQAMTYSLLLSELDTWGITRG